MLDLQFIRQNPDLIRSNLVKRKSQLDFEELLKLELEVRNFKLQLDNLRHQKKKLSTGKPDSEKREIITKLSQQIKDLEVKLAKENDLLKSLLLQLPNLTAEEVPVGDEKQTKVLYQKGTKPTLKKVLSHIELTEAKHLIDRERGSKVSGSRFWFLEADLVMLQFALIKYTLDFFSKKGFRPMLPPALVKEESMWGTGFFPAEKNEIYKVNPESDNLYLVGTAEVPMAAYHQSEVIDFQNDALKYIAYSPCFRREAGAAGKDTTGIIRGHQFDKLELFVLTKPEFSEKSHQELLQVSEEFWQSLAIPYQVILIPSLDLGLPNYKKFDIEAWIPSENRYREVGSCSNDTDFQARRLQIKYRDSEKKLKLVHTLNHTACALGRTMIAIIENYQQTDGSWQTPAVLKPYL